MFSSFTGPQSFIDDTMYGQATSDGEYDNVSIYDEAGNAATQNVGSNGPLRLAWLLVVLSLALLWVMGASIFRGSNRS